MSKGSKRRPTDEQAFRTRYARVWEDRAPRAGKIVLIVRGGALQPKEPTPLWYVQDLSRQPLES